MKLVRLESDYTISKSQFTNKLAVPLVLGKNAKVALKTLSLEFNIPYFVIDDTNNTFQFKLSDLGGYGAVSISNGSYTSSELVIAIQNAINNNLFYLDVDDVNITGFEWKVTTDGDLLNGYKINIAFNRNDVLSVTDAECELGGIIYADQYFYKEVADNNTYNSIFICTHDVCRGDWFASIGTDHAPGTNDNISLSKWFFYLDANNSTAFMTSGQDIIDNMICGFGVSNTGTYTYKKNGSMVDSEINVGECILSMFNNYGSVKYQIHVENNNNHFFDGDNIVDIYPNFGTTDININCSIGNDTGHIGFTNFFITETPFAALQNGIYKPLQTVENIKRNTNLKANPSNVTINFNNNNTKILLGYLNNSYSVNALSGNFQAETSLKTNILDNDCTVEIMELSTGGYDHAYKMNRNIIGVITSSDLKQSISTGADTYKLSFKEEFQNFIAISNFTNTLTVNSLTVRVSIGGLTLPVINKMSCSLFFTYDED